VYLSSKSHPRIAQFDVYTPKLEIRLFLCCELVPNCFNYGGILDYALHRYPTHIWSPNHCRRMCICPAKAIQEALNLTFIHPGWRFDCFYAVNLCSAYTHWAYALHRCPTHIRSPNYCHRMCICQAIAFQKSLKFTFIHPGSRFDYLYALNLSHTAAMVWVFWSMLYTGTRHIFSLPTTALACVFVKQWAPKSRSDWRVYTWARDSTVSVLSPCLKMLLWWRYFGFWCTRNTHIFALPTTVVACVLVKS
jgi:hypothetical protein